MLQAILQPANYVCGTFVPLTEGFQIDGNSAGIQRRIHSVRADERGQAFDCGIGENHAIECLLVCGHIAVGDRLRRLRDTLNDPGILHREKALWNNDVEDDSENQRSKCD